jgi:transcriptional regulator with XRE-family HTH domain
MEITSSFGYWVRRQRKALDLTQQALAERVGCSLAAIKKIEGDERRPSRQIAERLADSLGVPTGQREIFLETARGLRSVDQLLLAREPASPSLPSGTVTFLFTDIEGSTLLSQIQPEAMKPALARHHIILRTAIESNSGHVFQMDSDVCVMNLGVRLNQSMSAWDYILVWSKSPKVRWRCHIQVIRQLHSHNGLCLRRMAGKFSSRK